MDAGDILYCVIILTAIFVAGVNEYYSVKVKAPPVPSLPRVRRGILKLLAEHIEPERHHEIVDLGCGWGGMLLALRRKFPECRITGYELSPVPYFFSKLRTLFSGGRIKVRRADFLKLNLAPYDVAVCYLTPFWMNDLKEKFSRELRPGSLLVSNAFAIPGWKILAQEDTGGFPAISVFLYRVGDS